ncbi:hypothetical protein DLAC_06118 [Tieghemostelium lacteum]|uniref:Uncharacterized protein n=1 Tax=Tieghemostelium lacteum TaxID=361077 RepID=A0A151ZHP1_TIELA|nr:hypothetical protein DLAC_06118 [Tieghemostelium lacteum]|eukprot:KYQ93427.1 hypothetical protein DLAC_06118 [Tieghemostelium lacteum]
MSRVLHDDIDTSSQKKDLSYWVCENKIENVQEILKSANVNVNEADENGITPLMWSCDRGLVPITRLLLKHGANINDQDNEGMTPLHYASLCGHSDIIVLLIREHSANTTIRDYQGQLAMDLLDPDDAHLIPLFP